MPQIDKLKFKSGIGKPTIHETLNTCLEDIHDFVKICLGQLQPREDCKELLERILILINASPSRRRVFFMIDEVDRKSYFSIHFASRHAKWVEEAIYSLKIHLVINLNKERKSCTTFVYFSLKFTYKFHVPRITIFNY